MTANIRLSAEATVLSNTEYDRVIDQATELFAFSGYGPDDLDAHGQPIEEDAQAALMIALALAPRLSEYLTSLTAACHAPSSPSAAPSGPQRAPLAPAGARTRTDGPSGVQTALRGVTVEAQYVTVGDWIEEEGDQGSGDYGFRVRSIKVYSDGSRAYLDDGGIIARTTLTPEEPVDIMTSRLVPVSQQPLRQVRILAKYVERGDVIEFHGPQSDRIVDDFSVFGQRLSMVRFSDADHQIIARVPLDSEINIKTRRSGQIGE